MYIGNNNNKLESKSVQFNTLQTTTTQTTTPSMNMTTYGYDEERDSAGNEDAISMDSNTGDQDQQQILTENNR